MMGEIAKSVDVFAFTEIRSVAKFIVVSLTAFMRVSRAANLNDIVFELFTRKLLYCIACGWTGGMYVCSMYVCGM